MKFVFSGQTLELEQLPATESLLRNVIQAHFKLVPTFKTAPSLNTFFGKKTKLPAKILVIGTLAAVLETSLQVEQEFSNAESKMNDFIAKFVSPCRVHAVEASVKRMELQFKRVTDIRLKEVPFKVNNIPYFANYRDGYNVSYLYFTVIAKDKAGFDAALAHVRKNSDYAGVFDELLSIALLAQNTHAIDAIVPLIANDLVFFSLIRLAIASIVLSDKMEFFFFVCDLITARFPELSSDRAVSLIIAIAIEGHSTWHARQFVQRFKLDDVVTSNINDLRRTAFQLNSVGTLKWLHEFYPDSAWNWEEFPRRDRTDKWFAPDEVAVGTFLVANRHKIQLPIRTFQWILHGFCMLDEEQQEEVSCAMRTEFMRQVRPVFQEVLARDSNFCRDLFPLINSPIAFNEISLLFEKGQFDQYGIMPFNLARRDRTRFADTAVRLMAPIHISKLPIHSCRILCDALDNCLHEIQFFVSHRPNFEKITALSRDTINVVYEYLGVNVYAESKLMNASITTREQYRLRRIAALVSDFPSWAMIVMKQVKAHGWQEQKWNTDMQREVEALWTEAPGSFSSQDDAEEEAGLEMKEHKENVVMSDTSESSSAGSSTSSTTEMNDDDSTGDSESATRASHARAQARFNRAVQFFCQSETGLKIFETRLISRQEEQARALYVRTHHFEIQEHMPSKKHEGEALPKVEEFIETPDGKRLIVMLWANERKKGRRTWHELDTELLQDPLLFDKTKLVDIITF